MFPSKPSPGSSSTQSDGWRPRSWQGHGYVRPGHGTWGVLSMSHCAAWGRRGGSALTVLSLQRQSRPIQLPCWLGGQRTSSPWHCSQPHTPFHIHQESPPEEVHTTVALATFPPWHRSGEQHCCLVHTLWSPQASPTSPTSAPRPRPGKAWRPNWAQGVGAGSEPLSEPPVQGARLSSSQLPGSQGERALPPPPSTDAVAEGPVPSGLDLQGVSGPGTYMLGVGVREGR